MQVNHFGEFVHHDDLVHLRHFLSGTEVMEGIDGGQSLIYSPAERPVANDPFLLLLVLMTDSAPKKPSDCIND